MYTERNKEKGNKKNNAAKYGTKKSGNKHKSCSFYQLIKRQCSYKARAAVNSGEPNNGTSQSDKERTLVKNF